MLCNERIIEFWYGLPPLGSELYFKDKENELKEL
jgi:hypothetical protein